mgnify:CR=1 FL=1
MRNNTIWMCLFCLSVISVLISCGNAGKNKLAYVGESLQLNDAGKLDTVLHTIPVFSFMNQDSVLVTSADYAGKIYVADFFFTSCPTICKEMSGNLVELQKIVSIFPEVHILSHTVNPDFDTPDVLKKYAEDLGANTLNWNFVTGEKEVIYKQGLEGYFIEAEKSEIAPGGFLHSELFVLVDKQGHIRSSRDEFGNPIAAYDGTNHEDVKKLIQDIKTLVKE